MFKLERLETWRKAIQFADRVYCVTKTVPDDARFGLTSQMRRAAVSISSNIVEGTPRDTRDDYARFLEFATGSNFEMILRSFISRNQGFLTEQNFQAVYTAAEEPSRMLSGLRRSLRSP